MKINSLIEQYQKDFPDCLIVFALGAIGDICYCLSCASLVQSVRKQQIVVITSEKRLPLVRCFEAVRHTVVAEASVIPALNDYLIQEQFSFLHCYDNRFQVLSCQALRKEEYINAVKTAGKNVSLREMLLPHGISEYSPAPLHIPNGDISPFNLDKKTVIINPYSDTMPLDSPEPFQTVADALRQKGYRVYTNVLPGQAHLNHTERLECSIFELFHCVEQAAAFISIRSGIIDFCAYANSKIFVLYAQKWDGLFQHAYTFQDFVGPAEIIEYPLNDTSLQAINDSF